MRSRLISRALGSRPAGSVRPAGLPCYTSRVQLPAAVVRGRHSPITGTASRGTDGGDDPTPHSLDGHSANFGLGCDILAQAPSEAIGYECGVARVRADSVVHKRDLPVVGAWIEIGEANSRLQERIHLLGQFRVGVQGTHDSS